MRIRPLSSRPGSSAAPSPILLSDSPASRAESSKIAAHLCPPYSTHSLVGASLTTMFSTVCPVVSHLGKTPLVRRPPPPPPHPSAQMPGLQPCDYLFLRSAPRANGYMVTCHSRLSREPCFTIKQAREKSARPAITVMSPSPPPRCLRPREGVCRKPSEDEGGGHTSR